MNTTTAVRALQALAHTQRLKIFRALVVEGPNGLYAGALAKRVRATPAATSFHLKELERAGLVHATRQGRFILYAIRIDGMRQLMTYLTEDCCGGRPDLCGATFASGGSICSKSGEKV